MNVRRRQELTEKLRSDLGEALITSNIVSLETAQSVVAINPNRENEISTTESTNYMLDALSSSVLGPLGDYYMLDFPANMVGFVLVSQGYWWGIVVNKVGVSLGMMFNAVLPRPLFFEG